MMRKWNPRLLGLGALALALGCRSTPTPPPSVEAQEQTDRTLLYLIGAGLVVLFVVIGYVITRDARSSLPEEARTEPGQRDQGPHRHAQQAKAKARAKTKAQRRARRQNR